MVEIEEFSHVGIRTDDVETSIEQLQCLLGAEVVDRGEIDHPDWETTPDYVELTLADMGIFVVNPTPYEAAGLVNPLRAGIAHYGVVVKDINEILDEWTSAGGSVLMEPFTLGDHRYAFVNGPDKTRVEFVESGESPR